MDGPSALAFLPEVLDEGNVPVLIEYRPQIFSLHKQLSKLNVGIGGHVQRMELVRTDVALPATTNRRELGGSSIASVAILMIGRFSIGPTTRLALDAP